MYTKEKVIELITDAINYGINYNGNLSDKWIEQNL
jgi:hypothetical protein